MSEIIKFEFFTPEEKKPDDHILIFAMLPQGVVRAGYVLNGIFIPEFAARIESVQHKFEDVLMWAYAREMRSSPGFGIQKKRKN